MTLISPCLNKVWTQHDNSLIELSICFSALKYLARIWHGGGGRFSSEIENLKGENHNAVPPSPHLPLIPPDTLHLVAPLLHIAIATLSPMPRIQFIHNYQLAQFCAIKFVHIIIFLASAKWPPLMLSNKHSPFPLLQGRLRTVLRPRLIHSATWRSSVVYGT